MPTHADLINDAKAILAAIRDENQRKNIKTSWFFPSDAEMATVRLNKALKDTSANLAFRAKELLDGYYPKLKIYNRLNISLSNGTPLLSLYNGYTNLHWSVIDDNDDEFKMSLLHSHVHAFDFDSNVFAEHNLKDNLGRTPLHLAAIQGNLKKFLRHFPQPQQDKLLAMQDHEGKTALHLIAEQDPLQISLVVDELIQNNLLFIKDHTGKTALHLAAEQGHFSEFLQRIPEIKQDKLKAITDVAGQTAQDYAREWERLHPEEVNHMENRYN